MLSSIYPLIIIHITEEKYGTTTERMLISSGVNAVLINDVDKKVAIFSGTLMNIMQNPVPMKLSYVMKETPCIKQTINLTEKPVQQTILSK